MKVPKAREMRKLARRYMEDNEPLLDKQRGNFLTVAIVEVYALLLYFIPVVAGYEKLGHSWQGIVFLLGALGIWVLVFSAWVYFIDDDKTRFPNLIDYYFEKVHKEQP